MKNPITLRGMATADQVRMFRVRGVPMIVRPIATDAEIPPGWLPVLMATQEPKKKSPSDIRRNQSRQGWRAKRDAARAEQQSLEQ